MKTASINILFLLVLNLHSFAQNGLTAKLIFPDKIISGKSLNINLKIEKPDGLNGFTVFSQKIPEGFFVKPVNTQNADFSFKNNTFTLTWIRLPAQKTNDIFYEISYIKGTTGKFKLESEINYLINNKKGTFKLNDAEFEIISEKINENTDYNRQFYADYKCTRQKIPLENGKILVKIKINNFDKDNFILTEEFPVGYKAETVENSGTIVKKQKQTIQFISGNIRDKKEITLKYELIPTTKKTKNEIKIYGKLTFLENQNIFNVPVLEKP